jgi:hypothetical protein
MFQTVQTKRSWMNSRLIQDDIAAMRAQGIADIREMDSRFCASCDQRIKNALFR